jgi:predicted dehydrogenase
MSASDLSWKRRDFVKNAAAAGAALGAAKGLWPKSAPKASGRAIGANDRINVGVIGAGGRGTYDGRSFSRVGAQTNACQITAVCDLYQKRITTNKAFHKCDGYLDYREVIGRKDIDAVIVATPDHWHAKIAMEAMNAGKDVYLEKPMTHTIEEGRQLVALAKETGRIVQIGSQTTSGAHWWKTRQLIADGAIGEMVMSQGSYHRNSKAYWLDPYDPIEPNAGPDGKGDDYVDWKTWLGPAPKRPWDADRFFHFRKYWDYGGGIATDLLFHVSAPINICWGEAQFPDKVMAAGGFYKGFKPEKDIPGEVPDTFHLLAEYPKGHSMVLSSTMANAQHIPGLIRGHLGTVIMVDHGQFETGIDHIILRPEPARGVIDDAYRAKFGAQETRIPIDAPNTENDWMTAHITNFLDCVRSRKQPTLNAETAACTLVLVQMAVQSYREGRVLYFDEKTWKVEAKPFHPART